MSLHVHARHVLDELNRARLTLATAESCTGGLLSAALTANPGASDVYLGGIVAYSDRIKTEVLGVDGGLIREFGAVDARVARAMAEGAARIARADIAVGITGIAGPSGGTPEKPVGLVYVAVATKSGSAIEELMLQGDRESIRTQAAERAFAMVLECVAHDVHLNKPGR